jgi:hypothetical protein
MPIINSSYSILSLLIVIVTISTLGQKNLYEIIRFYAEYCLEVDDGKEVSDFMTKNSNQY